MKADQRCRRCKLPLLSEDELDTGVCENCAEAQYEREQERREWEYYHPSDDNDASLPETP